MDDQGTGDGHRMAIEGSAEQKAALGKALGEPISPKGSKPISVEQWRALSKSAPLPGPVQPIWGPDVHSSEASPARQAALRALLDAMPAPSPSSVFPTANPSPASGKDSSARGFGSIAGRVRGSRSAAGAAEEVKARGSKPAEPGQP